MASNGDSYFEGQGLVDCSGVQITYLADMSEDLDGHRTSSAHVMISGYPTRTRRRSVLKRAVVKAASSDDS